MNIGPDEELVSRVRMQWSILQNVSNSVNNGKLSFEKSFWLKWCKEFNRSMSMGECLESWSLNLTLIDEAGRFAKPTRETENTKPIKRKKFWGLF